MNKHEKIELFMAILSLVGSAFGIVGLVFAIFGRFWFLAKGGI